VIVTVRDGCCDPGVVVFQGPLNVNGGFVGYRDQNDARDGMISFRKDFAALGQPDDYNENVVAIKDVGYEGSGPISYYEADEAGGVSVWQSSGLGIHEAFPQTVLPSDSPASILAILDTSSCSLASLFVEIRPQVLNGVKHPRLYRSDRLTQYS